MAGWLAAIPVIGSLFESIGGAIDRNITTDDERLKMKAELASIYVPVLTAIMDAQKSANEMQVRLTEAELKHEHWLVWSRRPIIAYLAVGNLIASAFVGHMPVDTAFYFAALVNGLDTGTRGLEKVMDRFKAPERTR